MDKKTAREIFAEVTSAGHCSHPIRLLGETVNLATGELRPSSLRVACKDRRAVVCPSCSYLYKADAWILVSAGLLGGKGLSEDVQGHPRLFVTLTAPSFGPVHTTRGSGSCTPRNSRARCDHGRPSQCFEHHDDHDPVLGSPLCDECFDYERAVMWNATSSKLWNRTIVRLRQRVAASQCLSATELHEVARLNYLKVAEFQRRGLVHFHVIVRCDGPAGPESAPPDWLTPQLLARELRDLLANVWTQSSNGDLVEWGSEFDIADITGSGDESRRVAAYVAKYATKTTDGSLSFARRFHHRSEIEFRRAAPHLRRLALTTWDLGGEPEDDEWHLRDYAHAFGFTGQLITKSRGFSTTFGALRAARAQFMAADSEDSDPIAGTYGYVGRGYSDPRSETLAELLHSETVSLHQERRERRIALEEQSGESARQL
jgi:hypothetical protein